jgi:signal transduction histidine kinase
MFTGRILKHGAGKPIHVRLEASPERVTLTVTDHGIGIAPEHQARIFERFERAVSERNYGGLGLGLYITRTIVEALGGTICVQSEPGQGACFTVELPREPEAP